MEVFQDVLADLKKIITIRINTKKEQTTSQECKTGDQGDVKELNASRAAIFTRLSVFLLRHMR